MVKRDSYEVDNQNRQDSQVHRSRDSVDLKYLCIYPWSYNIRSSIVIENETTQNCLRGD